MDQKELELKILRIVEQAHRGGLVWINRRMSELSKQMPPSSIQLGSPVAEALLASSHGTPNWWGGGENYPPHLMGINTVGDAVVRGVDHLNRFSTSRAILDDIRRFQHIAMEPDERMKRRKVSQALYTQKGEALTSIKLNGATVWGRPAWVGRDGFPLVEYLPDLDSLTMEDSEESP